MAKPAGGKNRKIGRNKVKCGNYKLRKYRINAVRRVKKAIHFCERKLLKWSLPKYADRDITGLERQIELLKQHHLAAIIK